MIEDPWVAFLGPVLTEEQIVRALGIDVVAIEVAVRWLRLLRLTTEDGRQVFPAWQLDGGNPVEGLQPVLETLRTGTEDEWSWALWLSSTIHERDGGDGVRRQIDALAGGDVRDVLTRAAQMAEGWAA